MPVSICIMSGRSKANRSPLQPVSQHELTYATDTDHALSEFAANLLDAEGFPKEVKTGKTAFA